MQTFRIHTLDSAPAGSRPLLEQARAHFGFLPNLLAELADAPAALEGYLTLNRLVGTTSLSEVEQQVVLAASSVANACDYCVAAHSAGLTAAGLAAPELDALRADRPLSDARLEALRAFTTAVVTTRGVVRREEVDAFLAAGFTRAQLLEVLLGVAMKTLSNYANHVAATPLDAPLRPFAWQSPARPEACCHA